VDFKTELLELLRRHGIEFDEDEIFNDLRPSSGR